MGRKQRTELRVVFEIGHGCSYGAWMIYDDQNGFVSGPYETRMIALEVIEREREKALWRHPAATHF